jgi:hypothetical protein
VLVLYHVGENDVIVPPFTGLDWLFSHQTHSPRVMATHLLWFVWLENLENQLALCPMYDLDCNVILLEEVLGTLFIYCVITLFPCLK